MLLALLAACGSQADAHPGTESEDEASAAADGSSTWTVGADGVERDEVGIPREAPVPEEARRTIRDFVQQMIPPPADETSDHHDRWFHEMRRMMAELMQADEHVGHAALHAFTGDVSDRVVTRRALLMIGTHCSPEAAAPLLKELMMTYGYRYDDRAEATLLLPLAAPRVYLECAEEHLRRRERPTMTMPPDEFLLKGWIIACEKLGESPVDMCADVSTNLTLEPFARYLAAQTLGRFPDDPLGRKALETCVIESSGDGYLRRMAAQSIEATYSSEDACALFKDILSKEVDVHFAAVLTDTLKKIGCR